MKSRKFGKSIEFLFSFLTHNYKPGQIGDDASMFICVLELVIKTGYLWVFLGYMQDGIAVGENWEGLPFGRFGPPLLYRIKLFFSSFVL